MPASSSVAMSSAWPFDRDAREALAEALKRLGALVDHGDVPAAVAASRSATAEPTRPQPTTTACFPLPCDTQHAAERSAGARARPLSSWPVTSEPLGIGLLGYGTVGSSVDRLLRERADVVERVAGRPVRVVRALVRDPARAARGRGARAC